MSTEQATAEEVAQALAAEDANSRLGHHLVTAILNRKPHNGGQLVSYITKGGTYVIASSGRWNDNGQPRDLAAIGRFGDVVQLSPTAAPEFMAAVRHVVAAS